MSLRVTLGVTLCLLWTNLASAQVKLEQKFPEETKYKVEVEQKTTQTLNLAGMNLDTSSKLFSVETRSIGKRASDGALPIEYQVDTLQMEMSLPQGLSVKFDSSNANQKATNPLLEPLVDLLRTSATVPIKLQLDKSNRVTSASLPQPEFEKLSETTKARFSPETLKKSIDRETAYLPDQPFKTGENLERTIEIDAGEGQAISFRIKYEYAGTIEKDGKSLDKITSKTLDASYTVNGNPALQVKNTDLKVKDSEGEYLFDRQLGATHSRKSKVQITGKLTLVIANMEFPGDLDLTVEDQATRQK